MIWNFLKFLWAAIKSSVIMIFGAFIAGTILFLIWPFAIPGAFPGLVEAGTLVASISWWAAVCLTWVFNILVKSSS